MKNCRELSDETVLHKLNRAGGTSPYKALLIRVIFSFIVMYSKKSIMLPFCNSFLLREKQRISRVKIIL